MKYYFIRTDRTEQADSIKCWQRPRTFMHCLVGVKCCSYSEKQSNGSSTGQI